MRLSSSAFENGGTIPDRYSRDDRNVSPPLSWRDVPPGARSLALVVDDPDAPGGTFVHWLIYDIPASVTELPEGQSADGNANGARQGRNDFGETGYGGPRPPSGTHHYRFHLYALDTEPRIPEGADRSQLDEAIRDHVVGIAELTGCYSHH